MFRISSLKDPFFLFIASWPGVSFCQKGLLHYRGWILFGQTSLLFASYLSGAFGGGGAAPAADERCEPGHGLSSPRPCQGVQGLQGAFGNALTESGGVGPGGYESKLNQQGGRRF